MQYVTEDNGGARWETVGPLLLIVRCLFAHSNNQQTVYYCALPHTIDLHLAHHFVRRRNY